jgi:sugar/nucleoside kinase (ribokinase family)
MAVRPRPGPARPRAALPPGRRSAGRSGWSGLDGHDLLAGDLAATLSNELAVPTVVVTLGEEGCVAHCAGASTRYPVEKVAAADTTGASDAFTASFAAHLIVGVPAGEAIQAAQSAAAWAIRRPGGYESMPLSI